MSIKSVKRLRRAKRTRSKIALRDVNRLTVFRSNNHIYAQIMNNSGSEVLVSASSNEPSFKSKKTGNVEAASIVGKVIAERALKKGIEKVAFDRSGYKYHGRVKAVAQAARDSGLLF